MRIQHNIMAMNAYRNYSNNTSALAKNLEKLSSGYKINRAGDDAAGLAISEKMRAQITGLKTAQKNAKDGISLVQTAEGALTEVHDMLNRMVELADQSANGTYDNDVDRANLQKEFDALRTEIDRIADSSNFNGKKLLDGSLGSYATTKAVEGTPSKAATSAAAATISFSAPTSLATGQSLKIGDYTLTAAANMTAGDIQAALSGQSATIAGAGFDVSVDDTGKITLTAQTAGAVSGLTQADVNSAIYVDSGSTAIAGVSATVGTTGAAATNASFKIDLTSMATNGTTSAATLTLGGITVTAAGTAAAANSAGAVAASFSGSTFTDVSGNVYDIAASGTELTFTAQTAGSLVAPSNATAVTVGGGATDPNGINTSAKADGAAATQQTFNVAVSGHSPSAGNKVVIGSQTFDSYADMDGKDVTIGGQTYQASYSATTGNLTLTNKVAGTDNTAVANITGAFKQGAGNTAITATLTPGKDAQAAVTGTAGTTEMVFGDKAIEKGYKITVGEGDDAVTFEFVNSGDTASSGAIAVTIGADMGTTLDNFETAIAGATLTGMAITRDTTDENKFTITNTDTGAASVKAPKLKQDGGGLTLQIGEDSESYNQLMVSIADMHATALGIGNGVVNIDTQANAQAAVDALKTAINSVSSTRGGLGATQNRLEHTINNLSVMQENIQDAESSIRDVDVADEMMAYTKNNILVQSAQAMLAQANQVPQGVLQLLQ